MAKRVGLSDIQSVTLAGIDFLIFIYSAEKIMIIVKVCKKIKTVGNVIK